VTDAANKALGMAKTALQKLTKSGSDATGPTIFVPWVRPANPGGKTWGQGNLTDAAPEATFRTFVYDISGLQRVNLHYETLENGKKYTVDMKGSGAYPSMTSPAATSTHYTAILPRGAGSIRYYVEAVDQRGNTAFSPVGRIFIA
jgi:hypothetical protein